ncbi:hypothetical protein KKC1_20380 [Calderihabitans maritimus]|uniref:Uncharacterized protein n=1 Tax=Calderihabitans maritimus TaxID=1246530 RepID=A0A1Z5HU79_9FIRM|nr:hypothetical protein KKC1_20380 [Calderihabitans maritimus]
MSSRPGYRVETVLEQLTDRNLKHFKLMTTYLLINRRTEGRDPLGCCVVCTSSMRAPNSPPNYSTPKGKLIG